MATDAVSRGLRSRSFAILLLTTLLGFGGYALLLPVVPLWVARGGASAFEAGLMTGVFMLATVVTQLAVPWLLARISHRWVLCAAMFLLGAPTPLFALSAALLPVTAVSGVRGIGFGLATVAGSALVAELVPPAQHGRANARFGIAIGLPQLVLLAAGVAAVGWWGFPAVFVIGGTLPVLAAALVPLIRGGTTPVVHEEREPGPLIVRGGVRPLLAMLACSTAQGGVVTFLPLVGEGGLAVAALLATAVGALAGRTVAGELVDRRGLTGRIVGPAALLAALGMTLEAVFLGTGADAWLVVGAALVGLGFGAVQNDSLTALFAAYGNARYGAASAAWNIAYDAGTGVGAVGLGALADPFGFRAAFGVAAVACAATSVRWGRRSGGRT